MRTHTLLFGMAILTLSGAAHANGRFPAAQHVIVGPGAHATTIVLRTTFGVVVSDDGGKTFQFICEEPLGYAAVAFDPAVALDSTGRIAVGLYNGASRIERSRCAFPRLSELEGEFVSDLDDGGDGETILAVTATGFIERYNGAFRSDDGGATYKRLGTGLLGVQFDTVERAPSNPKRIYATATRISPRTPLLLRSDDGGATWTERPVTIPGTLAAYISGVHKTNADVVFVRVLVDSPVDGMGTTRRRTLLVRSDDGLGTLTELARSQGQMLGFAHEPDGKTLWYGGPDPLDGLQRSTDSGMSWSKIADVQVRCLRAHAGELWVCGTEETDGFSLARSSDRGTTLVPAVHFAKISGAVSCPADSGSDVCNARWAELKPSFPEVDAGPPDSGASTDSGVADAMVDATTDTIVAAPDEPTRATGGGCTTGRSKANGGAALLFASLLAITSRRRPTGR